MPKRLPSAPAQTNIEIGEGHVTPAGGNVFIDLGFDAVEAAALKEESDRIIALEQALMERDRQRDIGAELLEAIHDVKAGRIGAFHAPPGTMILRCVNRSSLVDISGDDLSIGRLYIGRLDGEGCVRITDNTGQDFLYPLSCFEEITL